ncbi:MAG: class I adenylate-forming enzyme family protein, partial [Planctomycetota bacterium]
MKIIDLLKNSAENEPRRTAVVSGESEVSYKQLFAEVSALSEKLKQAGCSPGVKVAVVLNNSVEYLAGFFSISATGATIVPLSMRMTPREVAGYAEKADVSIIVTSRSYGEVLAEQLRSSENMTLLYVQYDTDTGLHVKVSTSSQCKVDDENADVALMVPTSGTTGAPKMVMLTDDNLISNMAAYRLLMGFEGHNVVYCGLSLHHIYCICAQILTHVSLADTFAVDDRPFFIRDFFKAVGRYAITATAFVPYMAILMAEYPDAGRFDLDSLKFITISGAKMPTSKYKVLTDKYASVRFINTYGMSEAGSRISIAAPLPSKFPADSVGRPMPGVNVRIADAEGNTAQADSPGEIMIKSSGVMKGYY